MVTQEWTYSREVSRNFFLLLYRKEMEAIVEEKVNGGMDGEGSKVQTLLRRLLPLYGALYL